MNFRVGDWNFAFYNVRKHRPSINLDNWEFDGLRFHCDCISFAITDVLAIQQMVSNRMSNVVYHSKIEYYEVKKLFDFVQINTLKIILKLFFDGYFAYSISGSCIVNVDDESVKRIEESKDIVIFIDPFFKAYDKTQKLALMPYLDMLDTVNNADLNLLKNYGAMGVLSPESTQFQDGILDDKAKEELRKEYDKTHGITFGKWALLITRQSVKFTPINLPVKDLELSAKRKEALAEILQFLNIPKELHAMFDTAKYTNRNEAERDMYGNKITATANMMLDFVRKVYEKLAKRTIDGKQIYLQNEFWFDIVNVPALQDAQHKERKAAREELKFWQEMRDAMPEKSEEINERIEDLMERI